MDTQQILVRKLREHSRLSSEDVGEIASWRHALKELHPNEDLIRQGDSPNVSALVVSGMVARYHLLQDGRRQYISFHMAGDMPDSQALFIDRMDHAVCATGSAVIASIPHKDMIRSFDLRPSIAFAIWRETLIDAAIFREAITNNSARSPSVRMAHLFCELFYRARASGLTEASSCRVPVSLAQLGETLGMSIASINRSIKHLRTTRIVDFGNGRLVIKSWRRLAEIGEFNPRYLHLKKPPP
jgi:CRP-like cAMP-binding protein